MRPPKPCAFVRQISMEQLPAILHQGRTVWLRMANGMAAHPLSLSMPDPSLHCRRTLDRSVLVPLRFCALSVLPFAAFAFLSP